MFPNIKLHFVKLHFPSNYYLLDVVIPLIPLPSSSRFIDSHVLSLYNVTVIH